jgi:hypothetical protein
MPARSAYGLLSDARGLNAIFASDRHHSPSVSSRTAPRECLEPVSRASMALAHHVHFVIVPCPRPGVFQNPAFPMPCSFAAADVRRFRTTARRK